MVRLEPLAAIQSSILPLSQAACWVAQLWSREPSHWASSSAVAPSAGGVALSCHGYCRVLPLGWLNTELSPGSRIPARSPKPRTP